MMEPTASGSSKTWELGRREGSANQGEKNKRKMPNKKKKKEEPGQSSSCAYAVEPTAEEARYSDVPT
jgi:hypothetical protein